MKTFNYTSWRYARSIWNFYKSSINFFKI